MAEKIVCVVGPTACGKTRFGVEIAKKFNGEVVSVDSMQIYRGMTVGTAAATEKEMDGVPHHMIAVADPEESWSVARFTQEADKCIQDILSRGKLPVLVGGTGLYLDSLVRGNSFAAGEDGTPIRKELEARCAAEGIEGILGNQGKRGGIAPRAANDKADIGLLGRYGSSTEDGGKIARKLLCREGLTRSCVTGSQDAVGSRLIKNHGQYLQV